MELDRITDWLWCLRTPVVQAYAVRERAGFNLIDTSTTGEEDAILGLLATLQPRVRIYDILLTRPRRPHRLGRRARTTDRGARDRRERAGLRDQRRTRAHAAAAGRLGDPAVRG